MCESSWYVDVEVVGRAHRNSYPSRWYCLLVSMRHCSMFLCSSQIIALESLRATITSLHLITANSTVGMVKSHAPECHEWTPIVCATIIMWQSLRTLVSHSYTPPPITTSLSIYHPEFQSTTGIREATKLGERQVASWDGSPGQTHRLHFECLSFPTTPLIPLFLNYSVMFSCSLLIVRHLLRIFCLLPCRATSKAKQLSASHLAHAPLPILEGLRDISHLTQGTIYWKCWSRFKNFGTGPHCGRRVRYVSCKSRFLSFAPSLKRISLRAYWGEKERMGCGWCTCGNVGSWIFAGACRGGDGFTLGVRLWMLSRAIGRVCIGDGDVQKWVSETKLFATWTSIWGP